MEECLVGGALSLHFAFLEFAEKSGGHVSSKSLVRVLYGPKLLLCWSEFLVVRTGGSVSR